MFLGSKASVKDRSEDSVMVELKVMFYKIIFDHDYMLDLFDLHTFTIKSINLKKPISYLKKRFVFISRFLSDYASHLRLREPIVRKVIII